MDQEAEQKFQEYLGKYCAMHHVTPEEAQKDLIVCAARWYYECHIEEEAT